MASITPLGAVTYVNQNTQAGSVRQANAQEKIDFAAVVNQELMSQEDKKIKEIRPTEAMDKLNPDERKKHEEEKDEEEMEEYEDEEMEEEYEEYDEELAEDDTEVNEEEFEEDETQRLPLDCQV